MTTPQVIKACSVCNRLFELEGVHDLIPGHLLPGTTSICDGVYRDGVPARRGGEEAKKQETRESES